MHFMTIELLLLSYLLRVGGESGAQTAPSYTERTSLTVALVSFAVSRAAQVKS